MKNLRWFGEEHLITLTDVQLSLMDRFGMHNWLCSDIGTSNWYWLGTDEPTIAFKNEEDKVKFILRWL